MTFDIIGEYCFKIPVINMFINEVMVVKHKNLITNLGESFFMNRCLNDKFNPIQKICIGNGINAPTKTDSKLGNETKRNTCVQIVNNDEKRIILTTKFIGEDLIGVSEIGVMTTNLDGDEILISHDVFNDIVLKEDFLYGVTGEIELEYSFYFSTSQIKTGWENYKDDDNVYWVYEPNDVISVYDSTTSYGLRKVNSIIAVRDIKNSYYHDIVKTNNLYIHLYHENNGSTIINAPNPNKHEIIIQNK